MRRPVERRRRRRGFTLMEVLLVMAILVIIGSIATVTYTGIKGRQNKNAAKVQIKNLKNAVEIYQLQVGTAPANLEELRTGPTNQSLAKDFKPGEIWDEEIPADPWGNKFVYKYDGQTERVLIYSVGPNGTDEGGGGDDITSGS